MHRPTFYPAVGGSSQGGNLASFPTSKVSSRDLPSQQSLKRRRKVAPVEIESQVSNSLISNIDSAPSLASLLKFEEIERFADIDRDINQKEKKGLSSDAEDDDEHNPKDEEDHDEDDDSDSDSDEEEELRREIEAIRKERDAANTIQVKTESQAHLEQLQESMAETKLTRHWTEDTVFRVPVNDKKDEKPRFINDSVRSDFHKRFLKRYIH